MSRRLTNHVVEGDSVNHQIVVEVLDSPGPGGAPHLYSICGYISGRNISKDGSCGDFSTRILFQNGPVKETGLPNGITHESLLAVVIDRLECFQSGDFACDDNKVALKALKQGLTALQKRTKDRIAREVEGTNKK